MGDLINQFLANLSAENQFRQKQEKDYLSQQQSERALAYPASVALKNYITGMNTPAANSAITPGDYPNVPAAPSTGGGGGSRIIPIPFPLPRFGGGGSSSAPRTTQPGQTRPVPDNRPKRLPWPNTPNPNPVGIQPPIERLPLPRFPNPNPIPEPRPPQPDVTTRISYGNPYDPSTYGPVETGGGNLPLPQSPDWFSSWLPNPNDVRNPNDFTSPDQFSNDYYNWLGGLGGPDSYSFPGQLPISVYDSLGGGGGGSPYRYDPRDWNIGSDFSNIDVSGLTVF